ncbi:MAG TPA: regulatory protein RecX [Candidatus Kapabacteria bacterium]|nr:regulatory protein RecX [Candidatus Kapabacteria bacterium]
MVIKNIRLKKNSNLCWLSLEDDKYYKIHIDIVTKYNLKAEMQIDENTLEQILNEQEIADAFTFSINKLSYGKDSIYSFRNKLKLKGFSSDTINLTIEKLKSHNYLNDELFAKEYIEHLVKRKSYGKLRIITELKKKGIIEELYSVFIDDYNFSGLDNDKINILLQKKLKLISNKSIDKQRSSLLFFLKNKGYTYEVAIKLINNLLSQIPE